MKKYFVITIIVAVLTIAGVGTAILLHQSSKQRASKTTANQTSLNHDANNTPAQTTTPAFDKTRYSLTDPASPWVIVNKQHSLQPLTYAPNDLISVGNGQYMRAEAATALQSMLAAASTAGYSVTAASGYRSYPTQVSVYNAEVKNYGQATADSESARPGYSEHQTGWAVDLASGGCSITDCFGSTPGGQWVTTHAYQYGFILRYTAADSTITGYRAEAWHFRYVGIDLATELHKQNIATLEQYFNVSGGATYK